MSQLSISLTDSIVLLPLRLEIRWVKHAPAANISVATYEPSGATPINAPRTYMPLRTKEVKAYVPVSTECWIRWMPDEICVAKPVGEITPQRIEQWKDAGSITSAEEIEALSGKAEVARKWETFLNGVGGPVRAKQVARCATSPEWNADAGAGENPLDIFTNKGVPLRALPKHMHLYTVKDDSAKPLLLDIAIRKDGLVLSPTDLQGARWQTDFGDAVVSGMGVRISRQDLVSQLRDADWLLAVGASEPQETGDALEEILKRNNALGQLALVPQDMPTNNLGDTRTSFTEGESDAAKYFRSTNTVLPDQSPGWNARNRMHTHPKDASLLAQALGVHPSCMSEMPYAGLSRDPGATAMAILLWKLCTNVFRILLVGWLRDQKENERADALEKNWPLMGDYFVQNVRASGPLPVLRVDENPYGVLPVTVLHEFKPATGPGDQQTGLLEDLRSFFEFLKAEFLFLSSNVPRLGDTDENLKYEKLLEILQSSPVSSSVWVRPIVPKISLTDSAFDRLREELGLSGKPIDHLKAIPQKQFDRMSSLVAAVKQWVGSAFDPRWEKALNEAAEVDISDYFRLRSDPEDLACDLVEEDKGPGGKEADSRTGYIADAIKNLHPSVKTATPGEPLLKRMLREAIRNAGDGDNLPDELARDCLRTLAARQPGELNALFLETLDLFSFRLDAWITGLAHYRLRECREGKSGPMPLGVYGWLEKPGVINDAPPKPQYIQAPSLSQGATAALLRSAALHNDAGEYAGPFQINLSSARVRDGLWYLEALRQYHIPSEILGYQAERIIHDRTIPNLKETDIYDLRLEFPLILQESAYSPDAPTTQLTVIDGEKFLQATQHPAFGNDKNQYRELRQCLANTKDSAADIATAECVHQYVKGNLERTAAWQDFLDGECLPPEPDFVDTQRSSRVHSTRMFLPMLGSSGTSPGAATLSQNPRAIADPVLAELCGRLISLSGIPDVKAHADGNAVTLPMSAIAMEPIDVVLGGQREFQSLVRRQILMTKALAHDAPCDISVPASDNADLFRVFDQAELLGQLIQKNRSGDRWLVGEPGVEQLAGAFTLADLDIGRTHGELIGRADGVSAFLDLIIASVDRQLNNAGGTVEPADAALIGRQCLRLRLATGPMMGALGNSEADTKNVLIWLAQLKDELVKKKEELRSALVPLRVLPSDVKNTRNVIQAMPTAIENAGGNGALAVLVPYYRKPRDHASAQWTFSMPELSQSRTDALGLYREVRPSVFVALDLATRAPGLHLCGPDEILSDSKKHEVLTLVCVLEKGTTNGDALSWLKIDQWDESIPNDTEMSAVAFQYDSPSSEPPNVVLLATPPEMSAHGRWDSDLLARTVMEVIDLMKVRAVGSAAVLGSNNLGRYLPALLFGPSLDDLEVAPHVRRTALQSINTGEQYYFKKATE
jgi:hypothetical protein